jgi:mono/diheme cytochrome c family protein
VFRPVRSGSHRVRLLVCSLLALMVAAVATGCGRSGSDDQVKGKELFVSKCGSCHTLARASTKGIQGPNLDQAFGPARQDGLGEQTVDGVVRRQIAHPRRDSIMPKGLFSGKDARDVAAYVAAVAGQKGKDAGLLASAGAPKTSNKPIAAKGGSLEINADPTGALAFVSTKATAPGGSLQILSVNKASIQHDIAVEDSAGKKIGVGARVANGGTSKFTAKLKPGKYTFLCTVPGHAAGGMKGTLTVQ